MKKLSRILCVILVLALALSLSGCRELDKMKEAHAVLTEEGNILWNGTEYKKLPSGDGLEARYEGTMLVKVTEPDVPVLLSDSFGSHYLVTHDGMFIWDHSGEAPYCRADSYDDILSRIENGIEYTDYYYSYWRYNEEKDDTRYLNYLLTDSEKAALEKVVAAEPMSQPLDLAEFYMGDDVSITLRSCTEDMIFAEFAFDVLEMEDTYYVLENGDSENARVWEVPAELERDFDGIFSVYLAAESGEITITTAATQEQYSDMR